MENIVLEKINYVNGKDKGPAIRAENLNQTQQYVQNAFDKITPIITGIEENTENNINDLIATKQFIENSMKTMETEGTSIHVEDSADYPCKLEIEGKSEQVQTENSPSPEYPSEIENVSGDLEIKTVAKNLMKCETDVQTKYGVTITKTNDGGYILNGTSTGIGANGITLVSFEHKLPLLKNNSYVYSIVFENIPTNNYVSFPIAVKQADGTLKYNYKSINTETATAPVVFIPSEDLTTDNVAVYIHNGTVFNNFKFKIQIEEGTVATEYEPYKEQTVTFPLGTQKLMKDGYLGDDGIHNKRIQIVLTGNEEFLAHSQYNTTNYNCYRYVLPKAYKKATNQYALANALCSHLKIKNWISFYSQKTDEEGFTFTIDNNSTLYIKIDKSIAPTSNDLKAYLSAQNTVGTPVVIEYELEEEETTAYTSTQQTAYNALQALKTYRTITNISNNQDTNMQLTYKKDLQTQFQEIETMLLESGV